MTTFRSEPQREGDHRLRGVGGEGLLERARLLVAGGDGLLQEQGEVGGRDQAGQGRVQGAARADHHPVETALAAGLVGRQ